jgi:hypothetical protein
MQATCPRGMAGGPWPMCTGSGRCLIIEMLMASDERLVQRRVITHTPRLRRSSPERLGQPHLAHPTGTLAFGEAPSPGPTRRREAPSACSHWEAAPLPCARHFLWGTFLRGVCLCPLRFVSQYKLLSSRRPVRSSGSTSAICSGFCCSTR